MNQPAKILIIGGGYLGSILADHYQKSNTVVIADSSCIDITKPESVAFVLSTEQPNLVINAAAFTNTAAAELPENHATVFAINVQGPANLAYACKLRGIPLVHFSTGMFFDGMREDGQGWSEKDTPTPTNYYSLSKAWADGLLAQFAKRDKILILRIHTPISATAHPRNFLNRLQNFDSAVETPSSLTVVEDMMSALDQLLENNHYGLYNAVNPGSISAFQITELLQEAGKIPASKKLHRLSHQELDTAVAAKGGAHQTFPILSTAKLEAAGVTLPPVIQAVRRSIANLG